MPNHFHLLVEPAHTTVLSQFMAWLLTSHVRRIIEAEVKGGKTT